MVLLLKLCIKKLVAIVEAIIEISQATLRRWNPSSIDSKEIFRCYSSSINCELTFKSHFSVFFPIQKPIIVMRFKKVPKTSWNADGLAAASSSQMTFKSFFGQFFLSFKESTFWWKFQSLLGPTKRGFTISSPSKKIKVKKVFLHFC